MDANDQRAEAYVLAPGEIRRNPLSVPSIKADLVDTAGLVTVSEGALAPWESGRRCTCTRSRTKPCTWWKAPCWCRSARTATS